MAIEILSCSLLEFSTLVFVESLHVIVTTTHLVGSLIICFADEKTQKMQTIAFRMDEL